MRLYLLVLSSFLVSLHLISLPLHASGCGGGEGPIPFLDISKFKATSHFTLRQEARSFVFWENKNQIMIRTYENELRRYSVSTGFLTGLSTIDFPIAPLQDPKDQYVVTEGENSIFEVNQRRWETFTGAQNPLHLFWKNNKLHTLDYTFNAHGGSVFKVYKYEPGTGAAKSSCTISWMNKNANRIRLAQGAHYPYATLYTVADMGTQQLLDVYQIDVETCVLSNANAGTNMFDGQIQSVYAFEGKGHYGVFTSDPNTNFYYASPNRRGCPAYHIDTLQAPVVIDGINPTLAAWTPALGLRIYEPGPRTFYSLLQNWPIAQLGAGDIQISKNHDKLVLSPLMQGERNRELVYMEVTDTP